MKSYYWGFRKCTFIIKTRISPNQLRPLCFSVSKTDTHIVFLLCNFRIEQKWGFHKSTRLALMGILPSEALQPNKKYSTTKFKPPMEIEPGIFAIQVYHSPFWINFVFAGVLDLISNCHFPFSFTPWILWWYCIVMELPFVITLTL